MPGESVPQGMWLPPRTATLFVAANNALDRSRAQCDYLCDGVADDVQINQALNALPAGGGRVMLSEGTFNIVNPITIPRSNIILRGQGRSTFINGDGLATGEHGIVISGVANCTIKKLAIQTQDGGGKVCHCIFIGNWADSFEIEYVTIVDSDSDGIHIGGTDITDGGSIHNCHINDADGYGIMVSMNNGNQMLRLHVFDNFILSAGNAGIALWSGAGVGNTAYCNISGNVVYANGNEGIIVWDSGCTVISGNIVVENTQWGIRVRESAYVNLSNNVCYLNGADGILFEDSTECLAEGNVCIWSTAATSDGIQVEGINNSIIGNHCWGNGRHGINILAGGSQANLTGNFCFENDYHGINVAAAEVKVSGNYCHHNSQDTAGTYHGINLTGAAHRCQVNDNFCNDDGAAQEDGIHLEDGAIDCQIVGNYCYNGMGSGIALTANNLDCLIQGNYCELNDDYGIEITAVSCIKNIVEGNKLKGNVTANLLDAGACTIVKSDNREIEITQVKDYAYVKNTSGGDLVAGDVVSHKAVAAGNEVATPAAVGEDQVFGMLGENIINNAHGYVQVGGKTTLLKATNAGGNIAIGDFLCTEIGNRARLAAAGDMAFARALEVCDAADVTIDALIFSAMKL